eukprot:CAMPEP_0174260338 /NCGR_PEP_ID=MMETSP0439-20130205/9637_1 /TAXON_ID=0 /ORGANISM="Stereomyxa ramosa, Strain Chinc5" /LENGTH=529 /DNA_ID=CAMNT_0015344559 /DNA_START=19 /DNA_END=1608 /DNA_ORIENTATION=+
MARVPAGVQFPVTNKETGDRNTTPTQKKLWAAAVQEVNQQAAKAIAGEKSWRHRYNKYVIQNVELSLQSPENALSIARNGLDWIYENFEFVRDGETMNLNEALENIKGSFYTGFVQGTVKKPTNGPELEIPYKGKTLKGKELLAQLKKWSKYGTIEEEAAVAIGNCVKNRQWVDLSDRYFVVLGASSAMGPYSVLLSLGANVIAIDIDFASVWKKLITMARNSPGTVTFPLKVPQEEITSDEQLFENAGCNLITQPPEVCNWLVDLYPDKELTVGCYLYLDGARHVMVALGGDMVMKTLTEKRQGTSLAFLCTPTDCHVITTDAHEAAKANYNSMNLRNLLVTPIRAVTPYLNKNFRRPIKGDDGSVFHIVDGLSVAQGPNYALAKRLQHWRAILARESGCVVSSNVAPSTSTASVVHNRQFAWAYDGMPYFVPMEIFSQETSNAVMTALLINDLRNADSPAHPEVPLRNPLELFKFNAFHGGIWRNAYALDSIGEVSVLIHFVKVLKPVFLLAFLVAIIGIVLKFTVL